MRAWIFPGQGSHRKGMGAGLIDRHRASVDTADAVLGFPLAPLLRDDPDKRLGDTRYAQPALFVVEALTVLTARADGEPEPGVLAGHSLGEYAALFAAGCFDFETGVRLVKRRGELMSSGGDGDFGMLAVLGLSAEELAGTLGRYGADSVDIANHNARTQMVLSGPAEQLRTVAARLREDGAARTVPLAVRTAFHSRYMRAAATEFAGFLAGFRLRPPALPVIANVTAAPYGDDVAGLLARQIAEPVQWARSMTRMVALGVRDVDERGPGTVLTGLWQAALKDAPAPATRQAAVRPPASTEPAADRDSVPPNGAIAPPDPRPSVSTLLVPTPPHPARPPQAPAVFRAERLGSAEFRRDHRVRAAYLAGSMYKGISSAELVLRMGRAGLLGFLGTGGLGLDRIARDLDRIARESGPDRPYGANLLHTPADPVREDAVASLCVRSGVRSVEAAGFTRITPALVRVRFSGARQDADGPVAGRHVIAKVSRPEVARAFLAPAPAAVVDRLLAEGGLTPEEGRIARRLPVSGDLCVESDSGGHTDGGVALALLPTIARLRDRVCAEHGYRRRVRVGAAGGLGTPEAVAAVFLLGADFVLTGSVNQCSPEAGTAEAVKELLAGLDVQDTTYAPAGDMFELGARVQVVRKGTLFPARANKLYQLYRQYGALEELDDRTTRSLEEQCFGRPVEDVWRETEAHLARTAPGELTRARRSDRHRMALVFRWYFVHSTRLAMHGTPEQQVNYQIHCGPAMGAFNRYAAGGELADWRRRHVDVIADRLMTGAASLLTDRTNAMLRAQS
ncbi:ACP S-malonyltransferase [Streptomyces sp. NPDC006638]|uniref:ACP S-malonyltransferase n=1 Tax=Streptomyces sp. NPDC006638 TaxID=3157183 RepID=UPI0033B5106A